MSNSTTEPNNPEDSVLRADGEDSVNLESENVESTDQAREGIEESAEETPEEEPVDPVAQLESKVADLEDQLARSRAETYNVSQEYSGFVRRSKAEAAAAKQAGVAGVLENLLSVLDDIELARQHDDLEGPAGVIATKLENTLRANYQLERFGEVGDEFDPTIHEALMHTPSDEAEKEEVGTLIQPGYRIEDKVLRPARVGVVSPQ